MSSGGSQQPDHSYDLVLDLLRERMTAQSDRVNTLDSKANGIMTIATTILATALVLQAALFAISSLRSIALDLARLQWVLLALLFIYLLTMISATISGYWLRKFSRAPEPERLQSYATMPKLETQSFLVGTMTEVCNRNERVIESKVWGMRIATVGLLLEVIALVVLLFMQTHG
jgi:hypothetical protein